VRICFFMENRGPGYVHPVMSKVFDTLRDRGCTVDHFFPEDRVFSQDDFSIEYDLYVLKSSSPMTYQLGAMISTLGGRMINDFKAIQRIKNKVEVNKLLADRGLPVPDSYLTGDRELLKQALAEKGPLIVKPYDGRHGLGVSIVRSAEDVDALDLDNGEIYAQAFKPGDGYDRKVYVVGDRAYASKKSFAAGESFLKDAEHMEISPEMRDLALRGGEIVGLKIYGIDMIESEDGLWIIDVNGFPGFKGLPGIAQELSEYLYDYARAGA
jgi:ribosomal protein S6--L-glutamate ligase